MDPVEIIVHGAITHGADRTPVDCPSCGATAAHTVRGELGNPAAPVALTCVNGHPVPVPSDIDPREMFFTIAMSAE
jgi:hypothetical protein